MSFFDGFNPLKLASDAFIAWNDGRTRIREAKIEAKVAEYQAKAQQATMRIKGELDWDMLALEQSQHSLKDEWLLLILSLPFLGSFIPGIQDYVVNGWDYISRAPMWYQWSFIGIIAASFGLRWLFKGKLPHERLRK
jgi:hypothetical protein